MTPGDATTIDCTPASAAADATWSDRGVDGLANAKRQVDEWLVRCLIHLDPLQGIRKEEVFFRRKCLNELAYYVTTHHLLGGSDVEPELERGTARLVSPALVDIACRSAQRILAFPSILAFAASRRLVDERRVNRIHGALSGPFAWATEYPAFRQLDLLVACMIAGTAPPIAATTAVAASSLRLPPCPIYSDANAFYSLVHSVVYARMLGIPVDEIGTPAVTASLHGGLIRCIAERDADLSLELVLASIAAGTAPTPAARSTLDRVVADIERCGRLSELDPEGSTVVRAFLAICPSEVDWVRSFHLMVVAAMALTAALGHLGRAPDSRFEPSPTADADECHLGDAFAHLRRYQLAEGLSVAATVGAGSGGMSQRHLKRIREFAVSQVCDGGHVGLYIEEHQLAQREGIPVHALWLAQQRVNEACARFLERTSAQANPLPLTPELQ